MNSFNITDLKKHLGPGLGLRKSKYMLELPIPMLGGEKINLLCQSVGFPERTLNTVEIWHKGRRYKMRGETDYGGGEFEISIIDDSEMAIRQMFDKWITIIDDSRPDKGKVLSGSSYERKLNDPYENIDSINTSDIGAINIKYQVDINIWQMTNNSKSYVYGYKLQNAFPKTVGIVTLGDAEENTLSEFSVTFGYSEFIPLYGDSAPQSVIA